MSRAKEYKEKYEQAFDRMFELFKYGRRVELELESELDKLKGHLKSIKCIANDGLMNEEINRPGLSEILKIKNLCDEALGG